MKNSETDFRGLQGKAKIEMINILSQNDSALLHPRVFLTSLDLDTWEIQEEK